MKKQFFNCLLLIRDNYAPVGFSVIICLLVFGEFRRNSAVADVKATYQMTWAIGNSRAKIQIILINASLEGRKLNAEEVDQIKQLWALADYPAVLEKQ